jgi:plastocyanin
MMLRRLLVVAAASTWPFAFALAPAHAGGGCHEVSVGRSATVDLKSFCVIPTLIRVAPGTEVTFVNRDPTNHVIVGAGFAWGSMEELQQGDSFSATFERDGVYPFQCYLHPGMSGAVLVGNANGRGAATSSSATAPPASEEPPSTATGRADESAGLGWPGLLVLVLAGALVAVGGAFLALRGRRSAPSRRPAET